MLVGVGLLYQVTLALTKLQLMIKSARIATYGERAVDVFYVQDALGDKIETTRRMQTIERKLLATLEELDGAAGPEKKPDAKPEKTKPRKSKVKAPTAAAE